MVRTDCDIPFERTRSGHWKPLLVVEPWTDAKTRASVRHRQFWVLDTGADATILNASQHGAYRPEAFGLSHRSAEKRRIERVARNERELERPPEIPFHPMALRFPELSVDDSCLEVSTEVGWAPLPLGIGGLIGNDALIGHGVSIRVSTETGVPVVSFEIPGELLVDP